MKKLTTCFFIAVFFLSISSVCAQTDYEHNFPYLKAYNIVEGDSLVLETDVWYGSEKRNVKLQVNLFVFKPNGARRCITFCNVAFGEDSSLDSIVSNFPNGDNVIENAPLPGNTIKDYFSERPELYATYLRQREKILKELP